jgi:hypothetical protein
MARTFLENQFETSRKTSGFGGARNEITGASISTSPTTSNAYKDGWDRIFGNKNKEVETKPETDYSNNHFNISVEQDLIVDNEQPSGKLSKDGERWISLEHRFIKPTPDKPAPKGTMLIYTKYGKALIGNWRDEDCIGYFPLPLKPL